MVKIIYNNLIIDVIKNPKYFRYLSKSGRTVITDKTSAHCIMSSNNKDLYLLQGVTRPEGKDWKEVEVVCIGEDEYKTLSQLITNNESICADRSELKSVRSEKVQEISKACHDAITNGVNVLFNDGMYHTFELTTEDQLNLLSIESDIRNGVENIIYHEKGKICRLYSSDDMRILLSTVHKHRTYHTTYFNLLKNYIYSIYDINTIKNISYGMELPEVYNNKLNELIN